MKNYSINEVAKIVNINASKIRYYERIQILINIERDKNNNRIFRDKDIELLLLIICLRNLNMSTKKIKEKINKLNTNSIDIKTILIEHRKTLNKNIYLLKNHISELNTKINNFS